MSGLHGGYSADDELAKVAIWRCDVTMNPVGTDTEMIGRPCQCQGCRAARVIHAQAAEIERLNALLSERIDISLAY